MHRLAMDHKEGEVNRFSDGCVAPIVEARTAETCCLTLTLELAGLADPQKVNKLLAFGAMNKIEHTHNGLEN